MWKWIDSFLKKYWPTQDAYLDGFDYATKVLSNNSEAVALEMLKSEDLNINHPFDLGISAAIEDMYRRYDAGYGVADTIIKGAPLVVATVVIERKSPTTNVFFERGMIARLSEESKNGHI